MNIILRSMRNVLRSPLRLVLVVLLLGVSLMFVAAMFSLNTSAQQQLENVHKQVGTGITINYTTNQSGSGSNQNGNGQSGNGQGNNGQGGPGGGFGGGNFTGENSTPIPDSTIEKVKNTPGVASVEETLRRSADEGELKTESFTTPNGNTISIPPIVNGISSGSTHFTLGAGSTPTIVSGRSFETSDDNAYVAMMSQSLAETNNLKVGSTFSLKDTKFTIIGLYTTDNNNRFANNTITIPLATMQKVYDVDGVDSITAYATTYEEVDSLVTRLSSSLGTAFNVVAQDRFVQNAIDAINVAQNSIRLALIVSVVTAAVVIVFAVILLVRERTIEIGTLKAIGASHWQVIRQFWSEVLTLSLLAGILAAILLATLGPAISQQFNISTGTFGFGGNGGPGGFGGGRGLFSAASNVSLAAATLTPQTLLIILGLGIALAVLTSFIPSWYVAQIKPAEVLRKSN